MTDETLECILVRSDNENVVVNFDIEQVEKPAEVPWIDSIHRQGSRPVRSCYGTTPRTARMMTLNERGPSGMPPR